MLVTQPRCPAKRPQYINTMMSDLRREVVGALLGMLITYEGEAVEEHTTSIHHNTQQEPFFFSGRDGWHSDMEREEIVYNTLVWWYTREVDSG